MDEGYALMEREEMCHKVLRMDLKRGWMISLTEGERDRESIGD